jgi:hypothetical protein
VQLALLFLDANQILDVICGAWEYFLVVLMLLANARGLTLAKLRLFVVEILLLGLVG